MRDFVSQNRKILKFIISGGLATFVTITVGFVLTEILGLWYIISTIIGFLAGVITSFFTQKFWTFEDRDQSKIKGQFMIFLLITTINTFLYTFFVYVLVEFAGLWYLFAQLIGAVIVAVISFFTYQRFVFIKG